MIVIPKRKFKISLFHPEGNLFTKNKQYLTDAILDSKFNSP